MRIINFVRRFAKIFFGAESPDEMKRKGIAMAVAIPAVRWIDWILAGLTATLVAFFKEKGLGNVLIFFILWLGNIALSGAIVFANDKTKIDLTAMEAIRRLVDAAIAKSKFTGVILEILILGRLLIWDGPDQFIIFFRFRLKNPIAKIILFILASGFQMMIWTFLYILGYENFKELFKAIFR
ncbi:MAG: hypothetical protein A4E65_02124 [Syntrophorhabdus sp. PtaU1.Bin153]|nr:MAG: hypothetical protein A4E65_02124 [Syntrophorhabdus sp. PtaU1.Bin153]